MFLGSLMERSVRGKYCTRKLRWRLVEAGHDCVNVISVYLLGNYNMGLAIGVENEQ